MIEPPTSTVLDRFLDPVASCWTPEVARRIADSEPDSNTQTRLAELRTKANEGQLDAAERAEYEEFVESMDLVAILKAKARAVLRHRGP